MIADSGSNLLAGLWPVSPVVFSGIPGLQYGPSLPDARTSTPADDTGVADEVIE
jgi:hypothetical protein